MSMFICQICDSMRDSDDGCEEGTPGKGSGLICIDCVNNDRSPRVDRSYDEIYSTLVRAGCPDDIARELAREKSR